MCGITGAIDAKNHSLFDFKSDAISYKYIEARGPDRQSYIEYESGDYRIKLGHTRLSILDLSDAANQPMVSEGERFTLIYNGEIYNFKELRTELRNAGYTFFSTGDTEVLLKAWQHWGPGCLKRLNGMFTFAIFDRFNHEFFIVRDRFGIKPLLYFISEEGELYFSSSITALTFIAGQEVDLAYCSAGLRFGFFEGYENLSPFKKINYLQPGTFLKFSLTSKINFTCHTWYSLFDEVTNKEKILEDFTDQELIELGKDLLMDSVKLRLQSDVPLAISLSGGIDSSSIATLATGSITYLEGFCYGSPENLKSEGPVVKKFARSSNVHVNFVHPNYTPIELGDSLERTLAVQEAPFLGLSVMAQQEVYKAVGQRGFKVLLGGQGGDEIFAGYRKFFLVALKQAIHEKKLANSLSYLYSMGLLLVQEAARFRVYWKERNRYLKKSGAKTSCLTTLPYLNLDLLGGREMTLRRRQIEDVQQFSLPTLLRYEDRNSMSWSIESRLPYLDYRLIEFGIALRERLKIKNGYGKWISRKMMENKVPDFILKDRKKIGFEVTQNWITGGVGERLRSIILDNKSKAAVYVNDMQAIEKKLTPEYMKRDNDFFKEVMMLTFLINPVKEPINPTIGRKG